MASASQPASSNWLVSPAFDLLFLANIGWLLALLPGFASEDGSTPVTFWQVYFLTVPHRWLTLLLVAVDPDRREGRGRLFVILAVAALVLVACVRLWTGVFLCLLLVDYIWNGWHFASQHYGVLRLYARKSGPGGWPFMERTGLRFFICYVLARTAGWSTGWLEEFPGGDDWLQRLDWVVLSLPVLLLLGEFRGGPARLGKRIYLMSVCGVYTALLLSLSMGHTLLVLSLTVATAWFHAAEYLAVVTIYARRREHVGTPGICRRLAHHWFTLLAGLVVVLGSAATLLEKPVGDLWLGLNVWAAFMHYAYDGMIWKLRRPATANALGVAGASPGNGYQP